jgi:hypothetical protein
MTTLFTGTTGTLYTVLFTASMHASAAVVTQAVQRGMTVCFIIHF